jgi:hypothetical protein
METLKLRNSIKPALIHFTLIRGTVLGAIGICLILYTGIFLPPIALQYWGSLILLVGGGLITWGLLPYRRLRRLEVKPYEIVAVENKALHYLSNGKSLFSIPTQSIHRITYFEKNKDYGIAIHLKYPLPEKIRVQDVRFNFDAFQKKSLKKYDCDLFLPYFSERSWRALKDFQNV